VPEPLQWESPWEILSGVLITSLIFVVAVFIPVIGFFGTIFIPLPILFYRVKLGRQAGITIGMISIAVMVFILKALGGLSVDILFFSELLLLGYALSELFEKRVSVEKTVIFACVVALGSAFVAILGYSVLTQTGIFQLVSQYVAQNLELTLSIYEGMGISPETLAALEASLDQIQYTLVRIIPSLAIAMLLIVAWSNLLMAKPLFRRQQLEYPDFGNLSNWRTPETLIWGLIASGLLVLLPLDGIRLIGFNGLILMFTIYFFQGVAIVSFMFEKKNIPRTVRIFIYSMIALQQILLLLVVGLGIFDMWFDFRKLNPPKA
jgi:uncharacterized protein YybS (DUF2232 family)